MPQSSLTPVSLIFSAKYSVISAQVAREFAQVRAFRNDIAVMEGEKGNAEQREHLERHIGLEPRRRHVSPNQGRSKVGAPNMSEPRPGEIVPVADRRTQMVRHPLAEHQLCRVVIAIGERIGRLRPLVSDRRDVAEKSRAAHFVPPGDLSEPTLAAMNNEVSEVRQSAIVAF